MHSSIPGSQEVYSLSDKLWPVLTKGKILSHLIAVEKFWGVHSNLFPVLSPIPGVFSAPRLIMPQTCFCYFYPGEDALFKGFLTSIVN